MFVFLSKLLPLFVYPLGLASILLIVALCVKRRSRWLKPIIAAALAILWLGGNRWISTSLMRSLEWQYLPLETLPEAEIIVVLGGATDAAQYPRKMVELNSAADRILYASWLYHQGVATKLLLSGGYIPWLGEKEGSYAENMASILVRLGVPESAILLETQSLNTYENALYCKEILAANDINQIVLVTSAQHMPRALASFEKQGLEVIPAPTDYAITQANVDQLWEPSFTSQVFNLLPSAGNLSATTTALKEYIGIVIYKFRGWI